MKYFLGLIWIFLSIVAFAQNKDTAAPIKDSIAQQRMIKQIKDSAIKINTVTKSKDTGIQKNVIITPQKKDTLAGLKLPKYRIMLAGKLGLRTDSTSVDDILADPVIRPAASANFTVTAFELVTNYKGELRQLASKNDHLTKEMIKLLKNAMQGTPIIIQSVHYQSPDGKTGLMPGIFLSINK